MGIVEIIVSLNDHAARGRADGRAVLADLNEGRRLVGRLAAIRFDGNQGRDYDGDADYQQFALADDAPDLAQVNAVFVILVASIAISIGHCIGVAGSARVAGPQKRRLLRRRYPFKLNSIISHHASLLKLNSSIGRYLEIKSQTSCEPAY